MARYVREIINPEFFAVEADSRGADVLEWLLEFGITAVPVVDDHGRPIGVTSLRDLVQKKPVPISAPALTVGGSETVEDAARILAESGRHHLVVVGGDGRAIGMVSSLDLLRAVMGMPPAFPATFPHFDGRLGVRWSNIARLDPQHVGAVDPGPGLIVLSIGGAGQSEADLWVESTEGLRARLVELLEIPQSGTPALARLLAQRGVRFRVAPVADGVLREKVLRRLRERIDTAPRPEECAPLS